MGCGVSAAGVDRVITLPRQRILMQKKFFVIKDPIYLQSVIIHSANGGKGD
jgi:hypothetical protein